jgi:hypothetical protein
MKVLFVAWQDPVSRDWIPVGRLTREGGLYKYQYTKGAKRSKNFEPFGWMRDLDSLYVSEKLFPLFANRILPKSRPEYRDYLRWLGLDRSEYDELEVLARSGGVRATDTLEIFPCPVPNKDGMYVGYFFCHGLRHLAPENRARVKSMKSGERLYLMQDFQNRYDPSALVLRTEDPVSFIGYCPRYYSSAFTQLLKKVDPQRVTVLAERVSADAPSDLSLLCKLVAPWPKKFAPCTTGLFAGLATMPSPKGSRRPPKRHVDKKLKDRSSNGRRVAS